VTKFQKEVAMLSDDRSSRSNAPEKGDVAVKLAGEFDLSNASLLRERLAGAIESKASRIVIDMGDVTFIDSSGLAEMVLARNNLASDRSIVISNLRPSVQKVFDLTGLSTLFGCDV
jgi:anti-sigma B factor antagonist